MSNTTNKLKITLDIRDLLEDACNFFCIIDSKDKFENIEDYVVVENLSSIIDRFEKEFKEIMLEKLFPIAENINLFELIVKIENHETIHLDYSENGSYLLYFKLKIFTPDEILIGSIKNEKFSLHKYNFIEEGSEKKRFVSEVTVFSVLEEDCLKRISLIPQEEFILKHESRSLPSIFYEDKSGNFIKGSTIWETPFYKKIIDIFKEELLLIKNENIYDFSSNAEFGYHFIVEYMIGKEKNISFTYVRSQKRFTYYSLLNEVEFNSKINENNGVKWLMFKIFVETEVLSPEVLKHENISYKEAFEISKLLGY